MFLFIVLLVIPLAFVAGMIYASLLNVERVPKATVTGSVFLK